MFITKHTEESAHKGFALADINSRARAAYNNNRKLFTSKEHTARVELVDTILRSMLAGYSTAYQTARDATAKRPAHTEVKYHSVTQYSASKHQERRAVAVEQLAALGLDLIYKPKTNSYSVHVF